MKIISAFIVLCIAFSISYFIGVLVFVNDVEKDKCEMTYMFEYPQFVRIYNPIDKTYPKYGLYAYSEGRFTARARDMVFDGIPVIFLPGNAGSYKQVRSLSSVSLRKAVNSRTPFHFDYFTLDFNDELSALNGALLHDQLDYLNHSVYRVLELYQKHSGGRNSVILVGHSMGGVVAKKFATKQGEDSSLIPIVITLASPVRRPLLTLDYLMEKFYGDDPLPQKTTFVSLAGGFSDILIPSSLTQPKDNNGIQVVTTNIPKAWVEASHVQILWCKQIILVLNRALFNSIDPKTKQISSDPAYIKRVFQHHLVHNDGTYVSVPPKDFERALFEIHGDWFESLHRQYTVVLKNGLQEQKWFMVRLSQHNKHEILTVLAINLEIYDWFFACGAHYPSLSGTQRVCRTGLYLTHLSEIAPSARYKRRLIKVNLHKLLKSDANLTHVVFRALPTTKPLIFHIDVFSNEDRTVNVDLPKWWTFQKKTIIERTEEKAIHYDLDIPNLYHVTQFYLLHMEPLNCLGDFHHATANLIIPWSHHKSQAFVTRDVIEVLRVRLHASRPSWVKNHTAVVRLTLEPTCQYRITIEPSILGMLGQIARNYSPLLLANIAAVILLTFRSQLNSIKSSGSCSLFLSAMVEGLKPYYLLTAVKLLTKFLMIPGISKFLPAVDWTTLSDEGLDFLILPLLIYFCSVGIVWFLVLLFLASLALAESSVHRVALKLLAKTVRMPVSWTDYLMSALHKLPFAVSLILVMICFSACGSLALCLGTIFYFMKLTQMSQDFIEEIVWYFVKRFAKRLKDRFSRKKPIEAIKEKSEETDDDKVSSEEEEINKDKEIDQKGHYKIPENIDGKKFEGHNAIFFHSTIFFIWIMVTLLNLPAVLTWAHNFKFSKVLSPDSSFIPGLVLSGCSFVFWHFDLPKMKKRGYDILSHGIMIVSVLCLLYGLLTLYVLNYLLTLVIFMVTLHQTLAPNYPESDSIEDDENKAEKDKYDNVKAKWE